MAKDEFGHLEGDADLAKTNTSSVVKKARRVAEIYNEAARASEKSKNGLAWSINITAAKILDVCVAIAENQRIQDAEIGALKRRIQQLEEKQPQPPRFIHRGY